MSIFANVKKYNAEKWQVVSKTPFPEEDIKSIVSATVVASDYGLSVLFTFKDSKDVAYIPLDKESPRGIGEVLDVNNLLMVTLTRENKTIYRIEEK